MTDPNSRAFGGSSKLEHEGQKSLMQSLHSATRYLYSSSVMDAKALTQKRRGTHKQLNQLILSRLPRCLPPHTTQADIYANGLLHFAPIYASFEVAWQLLSDYEPTSELFLETAVVLSSLIHLNIPSLLRTERLRQDLSLLLQQPLEQVDVRFRHPDGRKARDFVRHIKHVACYKPHALIAHAWVLYMALFNGGRWIREQLSTARDMTWFSASDKTELTLRSGVNGVSTQDEAGLSFWHFEGDQDGDDIKEDFKARLVDVGSMLTEEHKADIVEEANEVFRRCIALVKELDDLLADKPSTQQRLDVETFRKADLKSSGQSWTITRLPEGLSQLPSMRAVATILLAIILAFGAHFVVTQPKVESG